MRDLWIWNRNRNPSSPDCDDSIVIFSFGLLSRNKESTLTFVICSYSIYEELIIIPYYFPNIFLSKLVSTLAFLPPFFLLITYNDATCLILEFARNFINSTVLVFVLQSSSDEILIQTWVRYLLITLDILCAGFEYDLKYPTFPPLPGYSAASKHSIVDHREDRRQKI